MPPLVDVRHLVKHFTRGGGLFRHKTVVRAVDGELQHRGRGNVRTGRRIRQRQDHDRPLHVAPDRADLRCGACSAAKTCSRSRVRGCGAAPRHADGLPGSVFVAQPAHARAQSSRSRSSSTGSGNARARRDRVAELFPGWTRAGAPRALPARVQRRAAAAHRPRASAGLEPVVPHPRRTRVRARRLVQAQVINLLMDLQGSCELTYLFIAHDLRLVRTHLRPRGGDVPRQDRRDGDDGERSSSAAASVHAGAAVGDPGDGSGCAGDAHRARPRRVNRRTAA